MFYSSVKMKLASLTELGGIHSVVRIFSLLHKMKELWNEIWC